MDIRALIPWIGSLVSVVTAAICLALQVSRTLKKADDLVKASRRGRNFPITCESASRTASRSRTKSSAPACPRVPQSAVAR